MTEETENATGHSESETEDGIDIDPMRLADLQNEFMHSAQRQERTWYLQQIASKQEKKETMNDLDNTKKHYGVVTGLTLKHERIKDLREKLKDLIFESFPRGFGPASLHLHRRKSIRISQKLLRRLANLPNMDTAANLVDDEYKRLEQGGSRASNSKQRSIAADKCFPLVGSLEDIQRARKQHDATIAAVDPKKPWWRFYGAESTVDMRRAKAGMPMKEWLGDIEGVAKKGTDLEIKHGAKEEEGSSQRKERHLKRQFQEPVLLNEESVKENMEVVSNSLDDIEASNLWMSYISEPLPNEFLFGKAQRTSKKNENEKLNFEDTAGLKEQARVCRKRVLDTMPSLSGLVEEGSLKHGVTEDPVHIEQVAGSMRRLGVMDPWYIRSHSKQNIEEAKRRAKEATHQALDLTRASEEESSDLGMNRGETEEEHNEQGEGKSSMLHEQVEMAISLMEDPSSLSSATDADTASAWQPHASLGSFRKTLKERITQAEKAIERARISGKDHRHWGPLDKHVAARKIQRAFKSALRRTEAKNQIRKMELEKAEKERAAREERYQQVYGQLSSLLRQMVAEATGVEGSTENLDKLKSQLLRETKRRGKYLRENSNVGDTRHHSHRDKSPQTLNAAKRKQASSEKPTLGDRRSLIPRFRESFETETTVRESWQSKELDASDSTINASSLEDSTAATLKSSFGDYATPSKNRLQLPEYFDPNAVDRNRYAYKSNQRSASSATTTATTTSREHHVQGSLKESRNHKPKGAEQHHGKFVVSFSEQPYIDSEESDGEEISTSFDVSVSSDVFPDRSLAKVGQIPSSKPNTKTRNTTENVTSSMELPSTSHMVSNVGSHVGNVSSEKNASTWGNAGNEHDCARPIQHEKSMLEVPHSRSHHPIRSDFVSGSVVPAQVFGSANLHSYGTGLEQATSFIDSSNSQPTTGRSSGPFFPGVHDHRPPTVPFPRYVPAPGSSHKQPEPKVVSRGEPSSSGFWQHGERAVHGISKQGPNFSAHETQRRGPYF